MIIRIEKAVSKLRITAIILIATGWGWNAGNFTPPDAPFVSHLLHGIPILLLLVLGLPLLCISGTPQQEEAKAGWEEVRHSDPDGQRVTESSPLG